MLTLYAVYWLVTGLEGLLRPAVPDAFYIPGSGLVLSIALIFLIGVLVDFFLFEKLLALGQAILNRVPIVKSIYRALQDLFSFLTNHGTGMSEVVSVDVAPGVRLIGFVTNRDPDELRAAGQDGNLVAVYLPMSYMIGGYTALFPAERVASLDISAEQAMRLVLTGAVRSDP